MSRSTLTHPRALNVRARGARWDVYVGRGRCPATGELGRFGNPFTIERHGPRALVRFLDMLAGLSAEHLAYLRAELRGRVLGCWCAPRPCHAVILARLADGDELSAIRSDVLRALGIAA